MVYNMHIDMCARGGNAADRHGPAAGTARAGREISFTRGAAMDENDTVLDKDAHETGQKADATERKPPLCARRRTRLVREQEARALREELGEGLTVTEIRARHGWTHSAYYRRARLAERLAREEYDPKRAFMIFLTHETRYRRLQRDAEALAEETRRELSRTGGDGADLRKRAALTNALVAILRFIGECEGRILRCAESMGIKPAEPESEERWTFAEFARAAIIEREEKERKNGKAGEPGSPDSHGEKYNP